MQTIAITPEMLANAPEKPASKRGRAKGSSPVAKAFQGFYNGSETSLGLSLSVSEMQALRLAVSRENGTDSSKVDDYNSALSALNLTEVFLGSVGEKSDKVITLALTKADN